jgi:hypothetical protein
VPTVVVDWADAVPPAMLEALNSERGSWVLRTSDSEFFGYKGSEFISGRCTCRSRSQETL